MNGAKFGGKLDVPAFTPLSYLQPGVPSGTLSEKITHTSKIYDGMKSEYWIYVPAQYKPDTPAAVMVFQDGGGYIHRDGNNPDIERDRQSDRAEEDSGDDRVFINPGDITDSPGHAHLQIREGLFRQMAAHAEGFHAQHALRHGQRPLRSLSARRDPC